jgi:hypothetical protein
MGDHPVLSAPPPLLPDVHHRVRSSAEGVVIRELLKSDPETGGPEGESPGPVHCVMSRGPLGARRAHDRVVPPRVEFRITLGHRANALSRHRHSVPPLEEHKELFQHELGS